jgi:putative ABC transport system permease protein
MMVMLQGIRMVLVGLTVGVVGALAATGIVKSLLFGVSTTDWITFVTVAMVLMTAAIFASYLPARRASHVDPMVALRYE